MQVNVILLLIIIAVVIATPESSKAMQIKAIIAIILAESCMIKINRTGSYVYT